jgi:hypothetical protein
MIPHFIVNKIYLCILEFDWTINMCKGSIKNDVWFYTQDTQIVIYEGR